MLAQAAAVVAALFEAALALAGLHSQRIALGAVGPDEGVPQGVEAVGLEAPSEELIAVFFVVQVMLNDAILIAAAGGVQAHLEVLVIHRHMVEAELQIGVNGQMAGLAVSVAQLHIPDFHGIVHGHKQGLLGVNIAVVAVILHIAQAVTAGVVLLGLGHRLPGNAPIVSGIVVPKVDIVSGAVHGNAVGAEAGDAVIL